MRLLATFCVRWVLQLMLFSLWRPAHIQSTITGNILNDGGTTELRHHGRPAGHRPHSLHAAEGANAAGVSANAAAVGSLQAQVSA